MGGLRVQREEIRVTEHRQMLVIDDVVVEPTSGRLIPQHLKRIAYQNSGAVDSRAALPKRASDPVLGNLPGESSVSASPPSVHNTLSRRYRRLRRRGPPSVADFRI